MWSKMLRGMLKLRGFINEVLAIVLTEELEVVFVNKYQAKADL